MALKRIAAIHDISCFGKCSLTVALPILSAAGIETTCLPTAVLSTHTGGFTGYTFRDLTEDIAPIAAHWKSLDIRFDGVYTGYLGSQEQIALVKNFVTTFRRPGSLFVCDPVMADNGKLYAAFGKEFPKEMAGLASMADLVVPNLTEAAFMLGEDYLGDDYSEEDIRKLLLRLADMGPAKVVLTGVSYDKDKVGAASYDRTTGEVAYYATERIPGYFHGTGDVYGSALVAGVLKGKSLGEASALAAEFTVGSIRRTVRDATDIRFGVNFEEGLPALMEALQ